MMHFFLQLCDTLNLMPLLDDQDSVTFVLSVGSLKGGGKNRVVKLQVGKLLLFCLVGQFDVVSATHLSSLN